MARAPKTRQVTITNTGQTTARRIGDEIA